MVNDCRTRWRMVHRSMGIVLRLGVALSPEEIIARKLYCTYGAGALNQAKTCASLARLMADWPSTGILEQGHRDPDRAHGAR